MLAKVLGLRYVEAVVRPPEAGKIILDVTNSFGESHSIRVDEFFRQELKWKKLTKKRCQFITKTAPKSGQELGIFVAEMKEEHDSHFGMIDVPVVDLKLQEKLKWLDRISVLMKV